MRRALAAAACLATAHAHVAAAPAPAPIVDQAKARAEAERQTASLIAAALPADGATDLLLIDHPSASGTPRVRAATAVSAPPASVRAVLLDPAHYHAIIPGIVNADATPAPDGSITLDWEIEIPLFNLDGRIVLRPRPDGAEMHMVEGDLSPGRLVFTIAPRPGGSTLYLDAQLDVKNTTFLLRRIIARSPVGEPAGLAAAAYTALRAVALRAQAPDAQKAWRPSAAMAPPSTWLPDAAPLTAGKLAPLRARGAVALVSRLPTQRLGGVAVTLPIARPAPAVAAQVRDPLTWRAFPGWRSIVTRPGARGLDAVVEDNLPLADFDATWSVDPGAAMRWTVNDRPRRPSHHRLRAADGARSGARPRVRGPRRGQGRAGEPATLIRTASKIRGEFRGLSPADPANPWGPCRAP
jgi:hypothetical protein